MREKGRIRNSRISFKVGSLGIWGNFTVMKMDARWDVKRGLCSRRYSSGSGLGVVTGFER